MDCVCGLGCFNGLDLNRQKALIIVQVYTLCFAIDFLCVRLTPRSQNLFYYMRSFQEKIAKMSHITRTAHLIRAVVSSTLYY